MAYQVLINSVDRTLDVVNRSPFIDEYVNNEQNICSFKMRNTSGLGFPSHNQEVQIILESGEVIFGGLIDRIRKGKHGKGQVEAEIECVDYGRLLDGKLVHEVYEDMTDREIIISILNQFASGKGISDSGVQGSATIKQISFNYIPVSAAFRRISEVTGYHWTLDYNKVLKYHSLSTYAAPFNITDSDSTFWGLSILTDGSQIKNRVYVKGGNRSSDLTSYNEKGDGSKRQFVLPDKPSNVSVYVDGVKQTLGLFNVDTGKQWYLNYQEKYLVHDESEAVLTEANELEVTYTYDIPVLIAQNDDASIAELGGDPLGVREYAIFDNSINSHQAARDRATAELAEYASSIVEASFMTYTEGFHAGQYMNINSTEYDIDQDYIIQQVSAESQGAGRYKYTVKLASAKTLGIINFLINMMVSDKGIITLDDNEAVDELLEIELDSLMSDSLIDSLIIDSAGEYRTWASTPDTSPTRARWNLFQWK